MMLRKRIQRFAAAFLAALLLAASVPLAAFSADADLTIGSYAELKAFADAVNGGDGFEGKTVLLTADISLGGESSPWTPIGASGTPFKGSFDGGGHIVSGHVDCVAEILSVRREGESRRIRIGFPASFGAEVIGKGSVALDGISLTVNDCGPDFLEVNVIPETWRATTVAEWAPGTRINMETDVIGKYVRHMVAPHLGLASEEAKAGKLSVEFLRENGFF